MQITKTKENNYRMKERYKNIQDVANPERMEIIFGDDTPDWGEGVGNILHFAKGEFAPGEPINVKSVKELERKGYLSFKQCFNQSPTIKELVESAKIINEIAPENGKCTLIGYIVSPERIDCRITIEGARYDGPVTDEVRDTFKTEFGTGYEFSESDNHLRRWHD